MLVAVSTFHRLIPDPGVLAVATVEDLEAGSKPFKLIVSDLKQ